MATSKPAEVDPMDDDFDDASDAFVKMEHLLGRLVLVSPLESGERESSLPGSKGKMYEYIVTDTVVLDGDVTELIDEVPMVLEDFQYSGQTITGQLKPKIRTHGRILGRLGQRPSQTKGFGKAWVLTPGTDADKVLARAWLKANPTVDPLD